MTIHFFFTHRAIAISRAITPTTFVICCGTIFLIWSVITGFASVAARSSCATSSLFNHSFWMRPTGISLKRLRLPLESVTICGLIRIKSLLDWPEEAVSSTGWFYGFKVHLVINERGELLGVMFTAGKTDDHKPVARRREAAYAGKLFRRRGYISQQLLEQLWPRVQLITRPRKNMNNKRQLLLDKIAVAQTSEKKRRSMIS